MIASQRLKSDIGYVRKAMDRSERTPSPRAIYFLWAAIVLIGFPLADFAPRYVPVFWSIAGPGGGLLSAFLGWRHARRVGQLDRSTGNRHMAHWAAMLAAIFSIVVLGMVGSMNWDYMHQLILLVIGLSYFLAGLHLDPPLLWVGILIWLVYFAIFFIPAYQWSIVAVVVAAGLIAAGLLGGRRDQAS